MEGEAEWGHRSQAQLKSLRGGELGGSLQLRIYVTPGSQGRGQKMLCCQASDWAKIALLGGICFFII